MLWPFGSSAVMGWLRSTVLTRTPASLRRWLLQRLTPRLPRDLPPRPVIDLGEITQPPVVPPAPAATAPGSPPTPSPTTVPTTALELPGLSVYPAAARYLPIIEREASARGVPAAIVLGTIAVESEFKERAYRAEPHINDASRGLMQLLYQTAKSLGFRGTPEQLYDPATNIALGTQYLADGLEIHKGDVWAAVSRYNNGRGTRSKVEQDVCLWRRADKTCGEYYHAMPGAFLNQPYVDKVRRAAELFGYDDDSGTPAAAGLAGGPVGALLLLGLVGALARRSFT